VSKAAVFMSMSLGGYIADSNDFLGGADGGRLHQWFAPGGDVMNVSRASWSATARPDRPRAGATRW